MDMLTELPAEVSEQILGFLDVCSLCCASRVCSQWNRFVASACSERVWKHHCLRLCAERDVKLDRENGFTWKEILKRNYRKKEIRDKWLQGDFSRPKHYDELPDRHMCPMDAESWGNILDSELAR